VLSLLLDPLPVVYHTVLFIVVFRVIHFCRFHMYADDVQIYHSAGISDLQKCYDEVNSDLHRIFEWAGASALKLKPKKSQVILIHRSRAQIPQTELYIGFDPIRVVTGVNNLGFVLNGNYG
jgi:hypothetical protein